MSWDMRKCAAARDRSTPARRVVSLARAWKCDPPVSAGDPHNPNSARHASGPPEIGGEAATFACRAGSNAPFVPAFVPSERAFVAFGRALGASEPSFVPFERAFVPSDRSFAPFDRALRAFDREFIASAGEFTTSATTLKAPEFALQAGSPDFLGPGAFQAIFPHHAAPHPNRA